MSEPGCRRIDVYFSGRVQGVGFRFTCCNIAARHAVTGYVRNEPDGRVRLVAEGQGDELRRFVSAVAAEMERFISRCDERWQAATGEFTDFNVQM